MAVYIGELQEQLGQLKEKYFNYNGVTSDCPDNSKKNISTTSSSTSSTTVSTAASHARGFAIANYRQHSGARHQLAPECGKLPSTSATSSTSNNATIPTALGGSTTTSPPIVILQQQQLDYVIIDYTVPTTPHPIKAKFSSSKSQLSTFAAPDAWGLRHEQSSCISLTSKNCESPSS
jgi:hypothetical protein